MWSGRNQKMSSTSEPFMAEDVPDDERLYDQTPQNDFINTVGDYPAFNIKSPKTILRFIEWVCTLTAFSTMASISSYTNLTAELNDVCICVFAWLFVFLFLIIDYFGLYEKAPQLLLQLEFVFDFMFAILTFFVAMDLTVVCNESYANGNNVCQTVSGSSIPAALEKANTAIAFTFFTAFAFIPSAMISYRTVTN